MVVINVLALAAEPVFRARWLAWAIALSLGAVDVGTFALTGSMRLPFVMLNDLVLTLAVVGIANLWVQSGMRARDAALLGAALTVYDFLATAHLSLTTDLVIRLAAMPFAPVVAWPVGDNGQWVGLGLGDLLFAMVFPLVLLKAYSRGAGRIALLVSLASVAGLLGLAAVGLLHGTFPVMVVLGPLMVAQERYWHHCLGHERTMQAYRAAEAPQDSPGEHNEHLLSNGSFNRARTDSHRDVIASMISSCVGLDVRMPMMPGQFVSLADSLRALSMSL